MHPPQAVTGLKSEAFFGGGKDDCIDDFEPFFANAALTLLRLSIVIAPARTAAYPLTWGFALSGAIEPIPVRSLRSVRTIASYRNRIAPGRRRHSRIRPQSQPCEKKYSYETTSNYERYHKQPTSPR
jgi:hypothetical protein